MTLLQGDQVIARTRSDEQGRFTFANVRSGVYEVETAGQRNYYRVWASNIAPPSAVPSMLMVDGRSIVRGQVAGLGGLGTAAAAGGLGLGGYFVYDQVINNDDPASP